MSELLVDDFTAAWTADPSGLWTVSSQEQVSHLGEDGKGLLIEAAPGTPAGSGPYAERRFTPALDLRQLDEIRFWLRSSRPGDGTPARPFYLAFEADTDPTAAGGPWRRLVPVSSRDGWELKTMWLGDMPPAVRQAVAVMRLRSLDRTVAFRAAVDDLVATRPEPLVDTDAALLGRLDRAFSVVVAGTPTKVPAVVSVPENPSTQAPPYILIIPWKVLPLGRPAAARDVVDNYTQGGAYVRPAPAAIQLEYALDVVAEERQHKNEVLERILDSVARRPRIVVEDVPVELVGFDRDPLTEVPSATRRTPVFYRVVVAAETGDRRFLGMAQPFVLAAPADGRETAETVQV
jgi:hypothetical protein